MAIVNPIILIFIGRNKIKENRSTLHENQELKTHGWNVYGCNKGERRGALCLVGCMQFIENGRTTTEIAGGDRFIRGKEKSLLLVSFDHERRGSDNITGVNDRELGARRTCLCPVPRDFPLAPFADRSAAGKRVSFPVCPFLCDAPPLELFWMSHDDSGSLEKEEKKRKGKKKRDDSEKRRSLPRTRSWLMRLSVHAYAPRDPYNISRYHRVTADNTVLRRVPRDVPMASHAYAQEENEP